MPSKRAKQREKARHQKRLQKERKEKAENTAAAAGSGSSRINWTANEQPQKQISSSADATESIDSAGATDATDAGAAKTSGLVPATPVAKPAPSKPKLHPSGLLAQSRASPRSPACVAMDAIVASIQQASTFDGSIDDDANDGVDTNTVSGPTIMPAALQDMTALLPRFPKDLATLEARHAAQVAEEEAFVLDKQKEVWRLTTLARKSSVSVLVRSQAKNDLKAAERVLEAAQDDVRACNLRRTRERAAIAKGEADATMWIAQLLSDPATAAADATATDDKKRSRRSLAFFKVSIGRFRALYGVSRDDQRDDWLAQLPRDPRQIITACQVAPSMASAMDGIVGEAGACVARGRVLMRLFLQAKRGHDVTTAAGDKAASTATAADATLARNAFADLTTGVMLYSRVGQMGEVLGALETLERYHSVTGDFVAAADTCARRVQICRQLHDFGGMCRASQSECRTALSAAKRREQVAVPSSEPAYPAVARTHLRRAARAAGNAVAVARMLRQSGMEALLLTKRHDLLEAGLECSSLHALAQCHIAVWEDHMARVASGGRGAEEGGSAGGSAAPTSAVAMNDKTGETDLDLGDDAQLLDFGGNATTDKEGVVPIFDDPRACATRAIEVLRMAVASAERVIGVLEGRTVPESIVPETDSAAMVQREVLSKIPPASPEVVSLVEHRLGQLYLELGSLELASVVKDQSAWQEDFAAMSTPASASAGEAGFEAHAARLERQQGTINSSAEHLERALALHAKATGGDGSGDRTGQSVAAQLFSGKCKNHLASACVMQGRLGDARVYFEEAAAELSLAGQTRDAEQCLTMAGRMPKGVGSTRAGAGANMVPDEESKVAPVQQQQQQQQQQAGAMYTQNFGGVDSDDELGEDGEIE